MSNKKLKASSHENYVAYTVISFILPIVGIILGIVYATKDKQLDKKLGEHLIAISILFIIFQSILWYFIWGKSPTLTTYSPPSLSAPAETAVNPWDGEKYYDQIQNGQPKAEVEKLIDKSPDTCSTTDAPTVGMMEVCSYGTYTDKVILGITYLNGKVYSKSKTAL